MTIPHLRWIVIGLIFLATVINYIDRQTMAVLKNSIAADVGLTNTDAHGIGEPANVATAAAIANAVYNAIGVRVKELPMTPKAVLAALGKNGKMARS